MSDTPSPVPQPAPGPVPDPVPYSAAVSEWGAIVISVMVSVVFIITLIFAKLINNETLFVSLSATASSAFLIVVGFWVGSSRGSQKKDALIADQLASPNASPASERWRNR